MKHLKAEFDKLSFKDTLMYSITMITLFAGLVLLFMGMLIPPKGEIHDSVLTAFGFILLFVAAVFGITLHYGNQLNLFKNSVMQMVKDAVAENNTGKEVMQNENITG